MNSSTIKPWARAIILVDMNAFFCSVEQLDNPELRGKPIGVTNGQQGTCIITCSYEARRYGVKTGMYLKEARELFPHLIAVPSHPNRYAELSERIMTALLDISPEQEIFSVDECFLDVTHCQSLWGTPEKMGQMVKDKVFEASGLLCSVGVSGDKTTAKYAAKQNKPDGLTIIPPWEAKERLKDVPVTKLCGIAEGVGNFLAARGVYKCGDMERLPISVLAKRFGDIGRRIWLMCQGADSEPLKTTIAAPKSMGHGKVMQPKTKDPKTIAIYLQHMCERLAARLRRHDMQAQRFFIGLRSQNWQWLGAKGKTICPTYNGEDIRQLGKAIITRTWNGSTVYQIQVTALDPKPTHQQADLFLSRDIRKENLLKTIDSINDRYGEFTLAPAPLLERSQMHNVIAPAWKPNGHRQSI